MAGRAGHPGDGGVRIGIVKLSAQRRNPPAEAPTRPPLPDLGERRPEEGPPREKHWAQFFGRFLKDGRPYISPSQTAKVLTCGAQWRYAYLENRPEPPSIGLTFGNLAHAVLEGALRKHQAGEPPKPDALAEEASNLAFAYFTDVDKVRELTDAVQVDPLLLATQMRGCIQRTWEWVLSQGFTVLALEERLETSIRVDDPVVGMVGLEVVNVAYPDAYVRLPDGRHVVIDWKFPAKSPSKDANNEGNYEVQRNYAHACMVYVDGLRAKGLPVDEVWVVAQVKKKDIEAPCVGRLPVTDNLVNWSRVVTASAVRKVVRQDLDPDPFSADWRCAPKWCAFYNLCPGSASVLDLAPGAVRLAPAPAGGS